MLRLSVPARRRHIAARQHLRGDAASPEAVTRALVALHATDPATVHLSVLARSASTTLGDISDALYVRRTLVRWMAMRRTLFVFDVDDVAMIQAAVSDDIAARLRRQLLRTLELNETDPPVPGDSAAIAEWMAALEGRVLAALDELGDAGGAQLAAAVPELATTIRPRTASERDVRLTTRLLTVLSTEGRMVRGDHPGAWTTRPGRWEPLAVRWPEGLARIDVAQAQRALARRYLSAFGPARVEDLQWWTGWSLGVTRRALAGLDTAEVSLDGAPGLVLAEDLDLLAAGADAGGAGADESGAGGAAPGDPVATLLPALDPTPMGYQERGWFLGTDRELVFDRSGNIGATVWWDGEIIGAWACPAPEDVRWELTVDRGAEAAAAVEAAASALAPRLEGARITPSFPTPLARRLAS